MSEQMYRVINSQLSKFVLGITYQVSGAEESAD